MIELLSPAGSPEALRAAVQGGAGSVYLGWGAFNARQNAKNFTDVEFADAVRYCHERGVRVFLTLNTLLSDRELPAALQTARRAAALGVDAVLVQDWGLLTLLRAAEPDLPLHASTQMSLFTSGGANEAALDGCARIVLARECSRADAETICKACSAEIELFAHGALCMCYSGQCAMSALLGGRSGNRGLCAQPCRLPYGVNTPPKGGHPLSLKDSCLAGALGSMEAMGVSCVKLEGRMKRPEYVYTVTDIYARLLRERRAPTAAESAALESAFSREGFTDRYWQGKRGPAMFGARPENAPEPKELFAAARNAYEKTQPRTVAADFVCTLRPGEPMTLSADDRQGHCVTVAGVTPEAARSRAVTAEELEERLRKTGGTAYRAEQVTVHAASGLSVPAAAVNDLRRRALAALSDVRCALPVRRSLPVPAQEVENGAAAGAPPALTVSAVRWEQVTAAVRAAAARLYVPVELLAAQKTLPPFGGTWCAVLPRVWRDRDEPSLRAMLETCRALGGRAALAGNLGHVPLARGLGLRLYGDFGLNVFNSRSLQYLRQKGLESACVSFELRGAQIRDLRKPLPTEAIVYGRLPLMITENCLVQNALGCRRDGDGSCVPADGPCAAPNFLRDRTGAAFPLLGVFGHRTEIENCKRLYLADRTDWQKLGLAFARLRFTTETPEECDAVVRAYLSGGVPRGDYTRGLFDRGVD